MKKISLKNLNFNETSQLSREQLKNVLGGASAQPYSQVPGGCAIDSIGLCGDNCMRPSGAADKCGLNSSKQCTCGRV